MSTTAQPKPLFLYLKEFDIPPIVLDRLRRAGYLPVQVPSFDSVKVIELIPGGRSDEVARAAFKTLADTGYDTVVQAFGRKVAKAYSESTP